MEVGRVLLGRSVAAVPIHRGARSPEGLSRVVPSPRGPFLNGGVLHGRHPKVGWMARKKGRPPKEATKREPNGRVARSHRDQAARRRAAHNGAGIGPTSRRRGFMILVDQCGWCGRILRSAEELTWRQYDWVRRINARRPPP